MDIKRQEIEVNYSIKCFPFESSAMALVEYIDTPDGKEIQTIFLPEYVHRHEEKSIREQASRLFHHWALLEEGKL